MMPPAKHTLTMDNATGLISSLFDTAFVPRCAFLPAAVHTIHILWTCLCHPLYASYNARCQYTIAWYGFQMVAIVLNTCILIVIGITAETQHSRE